MSAVQLLVAAFCLFIILGRVLRFFRREPSQSLPKVVTTVVIWGMIGAISVFPQLAYTIREALGLGNNFNTEIFIGFIILFALYFRMLSIIENLETTITELVRKEALRELPRSKKRKRS